jgi:putative SOS response-associated peptidase YedK
MCGRFVLDSSIPDIANEFNIDQTYLEYEPSYNIAPTHYIVVVKKNGIKVLTKCKWGFLPSWAKDLAVGNKMINARAETVAVKPAFRKAFKNQRCLIVADGFYEWMKKGKVKTPVYIRLKSRKSFGFAGLYNMWTLPEGNDICTCTIITTEANELLAPIHNRMPVIMQKNEYGLWLDPNFHDTQKLLSLLKPYNSQQMELYTVSTKVNSPAYNSKDNIKPV